MKSWMAIPITAGLVVACLVFVFLTGNPLPFFLVVPVTSIWAAIDSSKIRQRYRTDSSAELDRDTAATLQTTKPVMVFAACFLFWIFGFPWYLTLRSKLLKNAPPLKQEVKHAVE